MLTKGAIALAMGLIAGSASAASFDCTKASGFAETEICRDGYLSGVDVVLDRTYKKAVAASSNPEGLRQSQREWLQTRNQCQDQKCLDKALGTRIQELERIASAERVKAMQARDEQDAAQRRAVEAERERQATALANQQRQAALATQRTPSPTASSTQAIHPTSAHAQQAQNPVASWFINGPGWKYTLVLGLLLSIWAVVRHHSGSATIYSDYTDALITNLLPALGIATGAICRWLEMPGVVSAIAVVAGFVLSIAYAIYSTAKNNRGGLSIFLTLVAKLTLISVFYVVIGLLIASLFNGGARRKGESQARADARNRRERKATMALITALSAAYTALTAWVCRNPKFAPVSECLEFNRVPALT
ncbi:MULTISPECIES: lysozyme inhibitor LprI family protein [Pseudomonas]|uniref:lysozyme inhibitor LprI family protein n=1 Tax=Pseudomonas TaxID=286 RepID=UPI0018A9A48B|nr:MULTISPECIES: hypothetical protein [Pseudomonas]MBF8765824.1 hypothetical protein [Pseudomonas putida]MBH3344908.1 hypothetical protein [Pseudomonas parafulva]MEC4021890.1 hypothetical protein [Pseudomonas fulva]